MKKNRFGQNAVRVIGLIGLLLLSFAFTNFNVVAAQVQASGATDQNRRVELSQCEDCNAAIGKAVVYTGRLLTVSNVGEEINGNISSPADLIADPGPDGISLREAILAADASGAYDVIKFDPALSGSVIAVHVGIPVIQNGNLMIDGNIDDDASPDITIDGASSATFDGISMHGASNVVIKGLIVRNFPKHGIFIGPDVAAGAAIVENITLYQNTISSGSSAIELVINNQDHATIRDVEIVSNILEDSASGVSVIAGMGDGATDNIISGVAIRSNTIRNPGYNIGIFVSPAAWVNLSRNTVTNIEIRGNRISGHLNSSILLDASNQMACNDNVLDEVLIAENVIDGPHVTIELVGESGAYSTGNIASNITIQDNVLTGGGIQFATATGYNASNNTISTLLFQRNQISSCLANGVYLIAGSGGAHHNFLKDVILRDNFIQNCSDAGILLHGDTSFSPNNAISDVTITNQTLVNNGVGNSWAGGVNVNTKDASNTITGVTLSNSILWGNGGGDFIRGALTPDVVSHNLLADVRFVGSNGNFYQSPGFVDPDSGNYRLLPASACVDSGNPLAAHTGAKDLDHQSRVWDGDGDALAVIDRGAWESGASAMQEINVSGNGFSIVAGDGVPGVWDGTDFGAAALGGGALQQIFTIENAGAALLNLTGAPKVAVSGPNAADFVVVAQPSTPVPGGGSVAFTVEFAPGATGVREATINIANDDSDENPYAFAIRGVGTAPTTSRSVYLPCVLR